MDCFNYGRSDFFGWKTNVRTNGFHFAEGNKTKKLFRYGSPIISVKKMPKNVRKGLCRMPK